MLDIFWVAHYVSIDRSNCYGIQMNSMWFTPILQYYIPKWMVIFPQFQLYAIICIVPFNSFRYNVMYSFSFNDHFMGDFMAIFNLKFYTRILWSCFIQTNCNQFQLNYVNDIMWFCWNAIDLNTEMTHILSRVHNTLVTINTLYNIWTACKMYSINRKYVWLRFQIVDFAWMWCWRCGVINTIIMLRYSWIYSLSYQTKWHLI